MHGLVIRAYISDFLTINVVIPFKFMIHFDSENRVFLITFLIISYQNICSGCLKETFQREVSFNNLEPMSDREILKMIIFIYIIFNDLLH